MNALYNEIDPYAAAWLGNFAAAGHIAPGRVDTRSILDVRPADLEGVGQFHAFAGIAGWSLALRLAGVPDDAPVWTGSCPCQPFSAAGRRGGFDDARHLWPVWFDLIHQCRPTIVFGEQVASKDGLAWLDAVYADLEGAGYAVGAADLCAAGVGAPHIRQRQWFVAHANGGDASAERQQSGRQHGQQPAYGSARVGLGDAKGDWQRQPWIAQASVRRQVEAGRPGPWDRPDWLACWDGKTRPTEPGVQPLAHGVPGRVGKLRAYGNAIVPQVAAAFIAAALESLPHPSSTGA